jgi:NitT/TauT family transport system substrate-binding protein
MTRTNRLIASLACAVTLAILGGGCGGDDQRDASTTRANGQLEKRTLKIGALPITDLVQLYVADANGYFRDVGLKVEIRNFEGGAAIVPAVLDGSLDLGWSNSISILQARARGVALRFFAGGLYQGPGHWTSALMVAKDSPIRRPDQLRGRTVAINTLANINELVMRASLDRAGLEADAAELLEVPFPEQAAALESGRVDAILPSEPFVTMAKRGGARVIDPDPFTVVGSPVFIAAFFASDHWLRENPNTAAAFRRAVNRATAYWNEHPEERAGIIARYTKVPPQVAKRMSLGESRTEISAGDVQRQIELARKYGLIRESFHAGDVLAR